MNNIFFVSIYIRAGSPPVQNSPIVVLIRMQDTWQMKNLMVKNKATLKCIYFNFTHTFSDLPCKPTAYTPPSLAAEPSEILPRNTTVASFTDSQDGLFYRFYTAWLYADSSTPTNQRPNGEWNNKGAKLKLLWDKVLYWHSQRGNIFYLGDLL